MATKHVPSVKQLLNDAIYAFLYDPIRLRRQNQVKMIILENCKLQNLQHQNFLYKGQVYSLDQHNPIRKNTLDPSLYEKMNLFLDESDKMNKYEIPLILNYIATALNTTEHFCDYYSLFPEVVHKVLDDFRETCTCSIRHLSNKQVESLKLKYKEAIDQIKERSLRNSLE